MANQQPRARFYGSSRQFTNYNHLPPPGYHTNEKRTRYGPPARRFPFPPPRNQRQQSCEFSSIPPPQEVTQPKPEFENDNQFLSDGHDADIVLGSPDATDTETVEPIEETKDEFLKEDTKLNIELNNDLGNIVNTNNIVHPENLSYSENVTMIYQGITGNRLHPALDPHNHAHKLSFVGQGGSSEVQVDETKTLVDSKAEEKDIVDSKAEEEKDINCLAYSRETLLVIRENNKKNNIDDNSTQVVAVENDSSKMQKTDKAELKTKDALRIICDSFDQITNILLELKKNLKELNDVNYDQ